MTNEKANFKVRIGIDVGGTFTHAVAIDSETQALLGKAKVPTSHRAKNGVGEGIIESLKAVMQTCRLTSDQVVLVAHSTTQATNSLLEGDVEPVAIVSFGSGLKGWLTRRSTALGNIELAPGRYLKTTQFHFDSRVKDSAPLDAFLKQQRAAGVRVVVVAASFSVEDDENEKKVAEYIRAQGFVTTATSEISQLFGLRVRTRTAAINVSILPKMLDVAEHTEREIRNLNITAPLMIMRSDGGVMSVAEMRKRPILTLLSGPAAGIAAALRYLNISDGIFLEVGGTSTDISAIRNGRAMVRSATIGGNRTFLETLDCRTVGIGGGSLPRVSHGRLIDVGPRSAHIAGVGYAAFYADDATQLSARTLAPKEGDPADYLVLSDSMHALSFTPTCAANALNLVPTGDAALALSNFKAQILAQFAKFNLGNAEHFSEILLKKASAKIIPTVEALLKEYGLQRELVTLVGGGGGAAAVVPFVAKEMGMKCHIAKDNDVISAIGAALGLIRVVIEKSIVSPSSQDIFELRSAARQQLLAQGAHPSSVEVFIEVDEKRNILRAEAQGSMEYTQHGGAKNSLSVAELEEIARANLVKLGTTHLEARAESRALRAFLFSVQKTSGFFFKHKTSVVVVTDERGVVRLKLAEAALYKTTVSHVKAELVRSIENHVQYGDGGTTYPFAFCLVADRVLDLSKLNSIENRTQVLELETRDIPGDEPAVLIYSHNSADEV